MPVCDMRCELLITAPGMFAGPNRKPVLEKLGACLENQVHRATASTHYRIDMVFDREPGADPVRGDRSLNLRDGAWPDPLGLRLDFDGAAFTLESDCLGYRPIYHGRDGAGRWVISTRPDAVAAFAGRRVSMMGILQCLLLGYTVDDHSVFDGVRRLRAGELLRGDRAGVIRVEASAFGAPREDWGEAPASPTDWMAMTGETTAEAFHRGHMLELSGGVDSRLVLALGLHRGATPAAALTIGRDGDDDVEIARRICGAFDIEHHVVPMRIDEQRLEEDGRRFTAGGGFGLNASYAGLPAVLRAVSSLRTGQVGGLGGEFATGRYDTPLDGFCRTESVQRAWIRSRLVRSGQALHHPAVRPQAWCLGDEIEDILLRLLLRINGSWRTRTNAFYRQEKMRQWGGAVLNASNCYYESLHPLMHRPHLRWVRCLADGDRSGRRLQMKTIHRLSPTLGVVPYCGGARVSLGPWSAATERLRSGRAVAAKLNRRMRRSRAKPDLGNVHVVSALAGRPPVRESVQRLLGESGLALDEGCVQRLLRSPGPVEHDLGVFITAAWALESVQAFAALIDGSVRIRPCAECCPASSLS